MPAIKAASPRRRVLPRAAASRHAPIAYVQEGAGTGATSLVQSRVRLYGWARLSCYWTRKGFLDEELLLLVGMRFKAVIARDAERGKTWQMIS
ncbi:hypothetical protein DXC81_01705 [Collinsella tanakaei]|uniref:Uncharacterized protein n=1 Tax=Collinsella tanakaei TaxID=626935 RepID=A0A3E4QXH3_9ACTN|nr:hypothetical protein DXC81_01705 [Collinsella tanakaei]